MGISSKTKNPDPASLRINQPKNPLTSNQRGRQSAKRDLPISMKKKNREGASAADLTSLRFDVSYKPRSNF
jgi:hypothetical protein